MNEAAPPMPTPNHPPEIFFEFIVSGDYVRATAIDAATGVEATVVAPRSTAPKLLERLALQKLSYLARKHRRDQTLAGPKKNGGPGVLI